MQVLACIAPGPDEIVLPKTSSNVFASTNIDYILRSLGVKCAHSQLLQIEILQIQVQFNLSNSIKGLREQAAEKYRRAGSSAMVWQRILQVPEHCKVGSFSVAAKKSGNQNLRKSLNMKCVV